MNPISVIAVVHNEEQYIGDRFGELSEYVDEFVVIDQESTDRTVEIARQFTDKVYLFPRVYYMSGYMPHVALMAKNEWVIGCSPDEQWDPALLKQLPDLICQDADMFLFPVVYGDEELPPPEKITYGFRLWRRDKVLWTDSFDATPYNLDKLKVVKVGGGVIRNLRTRESGMKRYRIEGAKRLLHRYGDTKVEPYANYCKYYQDIIDGASL